MPELGKYKALQIISAGLLFFMLFAIINTYIFI